MFWKKEIKEFIPSCETCGHFFEKETGQCINEYHGIYKWYCKEHKKPYSKIGIKGGKTCYFKELEVSEDGTPVGY